MPGIVKAELSIVMHLLEVWKRMKTHQNLSMSYLLIRERQGSHVIVRIILLAKLETPAYYVVVGKLRHEKC